MSETLWWEVPRTWGWARLLADGHYSRQPPGAAEFLPPGESLVLWRPGAVWGVCRNWFHGVRRWRVTCFRRVTGPLASDLIAAGTEATRRHWHDRYEVPAEPLETEVDAAKVRRKRDPGRCFLRAGWRFVEVRNGLHVFEAP